MFIVLVYDIGEKRVGKALKLCRQYLNWIQNSVFEGNLTASQLHALKYKLKNIIENDEEKHDSIIIFSSKYENSMDKEILGEERMSTDNFL